jgi:hypothetical protein
MEDTVRCACGRLWRLERHEARFERRGRLYCRCNGTLAQDDNGSQDAYLVEPRERAAAVRRVVGHGGLMLLRVSRALRIPLWRWMRLSQLGPLLTPNRARHVRVELQSVPLPKR